MTTSFSAIVVLILLLFSGGGGGGVDLLATVPTETYWQLKNVTVSAAQLQGDAGPDKPAAQVGELLKDLQSSEFAKREKAKQDLERMGPEAIEKLRPAMTSPDAEVAAVASALVKQFTERAQERSIRRLMAIRTLGERREQGALPLLKSLAESKELFVAEYALRAAAQIEGKEYETANLAAAFARDLSLMPAETGMVGQFRAQGGQPVTIQSLVEETVEAAKGSGVGEIVAGEDRFADKGKLVTGGTKKLLTLLECTGNLRLDGATVAISRDAAGQEGWGLLVVRGQYNPSAVRAAIRLVNRRPVATGPGAVEAGGGEENREDLAPTVATLLPSEEMFIIAIGPREETRDKALGFIQTALKAGKGTLGEHAALWRLVEGVDKSGPAWLAAVTLESFKREKLFEGIDSFTLETKRSREGLAFTFRGKGANEEKFRTSVTSFEEEIKRAQGVMDQQAQGRKILVPMADMLNTLKVTGAGGGGGAAEGGKEATLTGEVKTAIRRTILGEMGMGLAIYLLDDNTPPTPADR